MLENIILMCINPSTFQYPIHNYSTTFFSRHSCYPSMSFYSFYFRWSWKMTANLCSYSDLEQTTWRIFVTSFVFKCVKIGWGQFYCRREFSKKITNTFYLKVTFNLNYLTHEKIEMFGKIFVTIDILIYSLLEINLFQSRNLTSKNIY